MIVVMADDDRDDCEMVAAACSEIGNGHELVFVADGEELLDYLMHRGRYSDEASAPRPNLILLDLNMPKMDGREALRVIKSDPSLRRIPVVVLTTSHAEEDVVQAYDTGAAGYITKPAGHS
ncbi:MAG: response regulator, partial [Acidimicrobiia bacterium]